MGYACPVCSTPQADERHLADHLAITAMVHGDDHETWLDEHVEDWSSMGPGDLGPVVAEHAVETEYDEVFDDTTAGDGTGGSHDHAHQHGTATGDRLEDEIAREGHRGPGGRGQGRGSLTAEQRSILEEAREMTREMMTGGESEGERTGGDGDRTDGERDRTDEESDSEGQGGNEAGNQDPDADPGAASDDRP